jgi:uncharacterized protein (UPF0264 family)
MKLLVSVRSLDGALAAAQGGSDFIDIETSYIDNSFATLPVLIQEMRKIIPPDILVSVSLNEPNISIGAMSLSAFGAVVAGANLIKLGLINIENVKLDSNAIQMLVHMLKKINPEIMIALKCWVDYDGINPTHYPMFISVAQNLNLHMVMFDTYYKDHGSILDYLPFDAIAHLAEQTHRTGEIIGVSGALAYEHLFPLFSAGVDVAGFTRAVCDTEDRNLYRISREKVKAMKESVKSMTSAGANENAH